MISFFLQLIQTFFKALLPPILLAGLGILTDRLLNFEIRTLNRLCLYILSPALLFSSLMKVELRLADSLRVAGFSFLVLSVMALLGWIYAWLLRLDRPTTASAVMATTFFNAVTLGFPFVLFAFGEEGLRLAAVLIATNSLPHYGVGLFVAARSTHSTSQAMRKLIRMPAPYAVITALLFRALNISLPLAVLEPIDILGRAGIPVLLITIGIELGRIQIGMNHSEIWGVVVLRLLVGPLVAWGGITLLGLTGLLGQVVVLQASMPTAIMPIVFAREFGGNIQFISRSVLFTTLCSIVTLSIALVLIRQAI